MDKSKIIKFGLAGVLVMAGTSYITTLVLPAKVKIERVEVEKIVYIKKKAVDRNIVTEKVIKPDGTTVEKTVDLSKERETEAVSKETLKKESKLTIRNESNWILTGGVLVDPFDGSLSYVGMVNKRVVGPLYLGIIATSQYQMGLGLTLRF